MLKIASPSLCSGMGRKERFLYIAQIKLVILPVKSVLDNKLLFFFQIRSYQPGYLTRFSVAVGCQLGIKQFSVDRKLEATPV
jgi:hypothetical protein